MKGTTYNQLIIFQTIAREKSITKAARALEIAPASVSQALKTLEKKLALSLFTRTTRRIELTEEGLLLFEKTVPIIDKLSNTLEYVSSLNQTPQGRVSITMPRFVYQCLVKPIYAEFCHRFPNIQLEISVSDATIDILKEGIDLGIRFGEKIEEGMIARALLPEYKEALFASPDYIAKHGLPQKIEDLAEHKMIQYRFISSNQIAPLILVKEGQSIQQSIQTGMIVNDTDLMIDAAKKGLGIGRMVAPTVRKEFKSGELVPILEPYWQSLSRLYLYFHKNSQKAKRIRAFIDFLYEKIL